MHTGNSYRKKVSYFQKHNIDYPVPKIHIGIMGKLVNKVTYLDSTPILYSWQNSPDILINEVKILMEKNCVKKLTQVHVNGKRYPQIKTMEELYLTLKMMHWGD